MHRQTRADGRDDGLVHYEHLARARVPGRFLDGPAIHRRGAVRDADHQAPDGRAKEAQAQGLDDEVLEHLLGDFVVGDHAILQGLDDLQIARGAPQHSERFRADGQHAVRTDIGAAAKRDDGRFVQDDPPPADVNKGVGGAQIYGQIHGQPLNETTDKIAHRRSTSLGAVTPLKSRKS